MRAAAAPVRTIQAPSTYMDVVHQSSPPPMYSRPTTRDAIALAASVITSGDAPARARAPTIMLCARNPTGHASPNRAPSRALAPAIPRVRCATCAIVTTSATTPATTATTAAGTDGVASSRAVSHSAP